MLSPFFLPYSGVMAKIYTRTGDQGKTGLIGGSRVPKNHVRVEAYGTIDEANAFLGLILSRFSFFLHYQELQQVQKMLFEIGANLAYPSGLHKHPSHADVHHVEHLIDDLTKSLPELTHFIIPGGSELAAHIHVLRTIVRRAERRVITISQHEPVHPDLLRYLNRLSDYLFTLSRAINSEKGVKELPWHPQTS